MLLKFTCMLQTKVNFYFIFFERLQKYDLPVKDCMELCKDCTFSPMANRDICIHYLLVITEVPSNYQCS